MAIQTECLKIGFKLFVISPSTYPNSDKFEILNFFLIIIFKSVIKQHLDP